MQHRRSRFDESVPRKQADDVSGWKERYYSFLNKPRRSEMRVEEARLLKEANLPTSLYKYAAFTRTVSKEDAEKLSQNVEGQYWTLVNLRNGVVSLRPPSTFNDPFDSSLSFVSKALLNDLIAESGHKPLEGTPLADMPDVETSVSLPPPEDALEQELQAAWKKDPKAFGPYPQIKRIMDTVYESQNQRMIAEYTKTTREVLRVACFSERRDSILLWSHYADHHRGICIEYETRWLSIPEAIGLLHPVNYHPEFFDVTEYFRSLPQEYNNWMLWIAACHKSPEWAYEREWRYIDISFRDRHPIRPKSIILGACIAPDSRADLIKIFSVAGIPLLQASLNPRRFEVRISSVQTPAK
jgi:Protein of unknown function (DUF2971)